MMVAVNKSRYRWLLYISLIPVLAFIVVTNSLLASEVKVPSIMEIPVIKETVNNSSFDSPDDENIVVHNNDAKTVSHRAKARPELDENISQPDVLESQSWLSTRYGDAVEFYDEKPSSKQEVHYTVTIVGDEPQIYQVTVPDKP